MSEINENENEFVDIPNFEGLYKINRKGQVKSLERYSECGRLLKEKILKNRIDINNYPYIKLSKNKKQKNFKIHILLFRTFIGDYDSKYFEIDHINRIRTDNSLENLRLVSCRNNHNNRTNQCLLGIGVSKNGKKYRACISIKGKIIVLGTFDTPEQAHNKYLEVKKQIEEIESVTNNYTYKITKIKKGEYFIEFFPIL